MAEHTPGILHGANKRLASLPHQTLHDFAATKRTGLPKRVFRSKLRKAISRGGRRRK